VRAPHPKAPLVGARVRGALRMGHGRERGGYLPTISWARAIMAGEAA
jgi:hypothetical protein